ncbi:MAG: glycoside hydrolase family 13 protein [Bacteroidales bacterium]|nr:glycoside hydrolase family 13 protein [Bacteroidales bacterium]
MKRILFTLIVIAASTFISLSQNFTVEPPNWWVGMNDPNLQLMVHGENIAETSVIIESENIKIKEIHKTDNPNYLFIDLIISSNAKPGNFDILFKKGKKTTVKYNYELFEKSNQKRGFSSEDVIYLIMPDRFANGDPSNDSDKNLLEKADRKNGDGRHGGDIQGVINNLDYIENLGVTGIWLNPVVENNSPDYSYHGYATTNFYKVDARLGTNELYKKLSDECHKNDLKLIIDVIYNHCGINHWWIKDLPAKDWVNHDENYRTTYRGATVADVHASANDKEQFNSGWFVSTMPDLNQKNPFLATYLIQNTIWWVEFANLDGIRIDTYTYPDQEFGSNLVAKVRNEYPDITILGETWLQSIPLVAYFQENCKFSGNYNSHLNSVTDFPLFYATKDAFNEDESWTGGLFKLYYTIAQDFLYSNPNNVVTFLDNHDLDRYFTSVGGDMNKFKMGVAFLLTTRGIPVIYYGTEIAMYGEEHKGHSNIRKDMPGGWEGDDISIFEQKDLIKSQREAYDYVSKILNWRKTNKAVKNGKLMHFLPENNVYVYFKYTETEAVMVMINNHDKDSKIVDCSRFNEILKDYKSGIEITTSIKIENLDKIKIQPKSAMIIELQK